MNERKRRYWIQIQIGSSWIYANVLYKEFKPFYWTLEEINLVDTELKDMGYKTRITIDWIES